ncbi:MAG: methyltransferase [Chromatiales bacterium]|nr:methyltransferase [Chromatiales bacterium]MDX9766978.1 methyltransferase [Ectothiorhodospiraceae bacterium]
MSLQKNAGAVRRFARAMKFGAWLQNLPNRMTPPPFRLVQIGSAFWQSRALYVAARLDLAGCIGDDTLDAATIAERAGADADATARLLRMLAAIGVFEETTPRHYRNNRLSAPLRSDHPQSVRAMILMHNDPVMSRPWYEALERGVREGATPFRLTHGRELFAWLDDHADSDALFSAAMDSVEALAGDSFATDFDWGRFERVIDVGGSRGAKSLAILKRHPHLTALVLDRPQVIDEARRYWSEHPTPEVDRVAFQAGDAFDAIPPARDERDVYFLSAVLHGFDDTGCITILRKLAAACGDGGARIVLLEMVLPEMGADLAAASFDMQMFMGTRGRERTLDEWRALFDRSGVTLDEVVGLRSFASMLVLRRKE